LTQGDIDRAAAAVAGRARRDPLRSLVVVGISVWTAIGSVLVVAALVVALAAVSEVVLPLVFALLVGAAAHPLARRLHRAGCSRAAAAGIVVLGGVGAFVGIAVMTVRGVIRETSALAAQVDEAISELASTTDATGLDEAQLTSVRDALASVAGAIGRGLASSLLGGVDAIVGFLTGAALGVLIAYYVLKDGPEIRRWFVGQFPERVRADADDFVGTGLSNIRTYWSLVMGLPLIMTIAVVNFIGGYVPYVGAFLGGGLAVLLALTDGGLTQALVMLAVVVACNLLLENVLEPRVMGSRLHIHRSSCCSPPPSAACSAA
jgi:putative heme transporter